MVFMSATPLTYSNEINTLLQLMNAEYGPQVSKQLMSEIVRNKSLKEQSDST